MYRVLIGLFMAALIVSADTASSHSAGTTAANSTQSVASVSGSGPFSINGASLAAGVPSWPVMAGDQITSGSTPVEITLPDGTELELAPRSKVTIIIRGGVVEIVVSSGYCRPRDPHGPGHCWVRPDPTSHHRCGGDGRYHDQDDDQRCCPAS